MPKLRSLQRPSPALVLSFLALMGAFGGIGYAAGLGKNSVGKKQIKANAVRGEEVKDGSLGAVDLAPGAVSMPTGAGAFRDPFVSVTSTDPAAPMPVATLSGLSAGVYAVTAKTVGFAQSGNPDLSCQLLAPAAGGGDSDVAQAQLAVAEPATLSMQLLHEFPGDDGQARVSCFLSGPGSASAAFTKIQAIRLSSATNEAVGG